MSVEKFKPELFNGIIKHEAKPYTQILNKVLQECRNLEAIALWSHFQSKPESWEVCVKYIQNHFKIGRDKVYKIIRYLIKVNLIEYVEEKSKDGKFSKSYYIIKNGEAFFDPELSTETPTLPYTENPYTDLPYTENKATINKRININKRKAKKKEKAPCIKTKQQKLKTKFPNDTNDVLSVEAIQYANQKQLNIMQLFLCFKTWATENDIYKHDWKAAFVAWVIRERTSNVVQINKNENVRRGYDRDFTAERLERERQNEIKNGG